MITKDESDQELADNLSAIAENQEAALAATGTYATVYTVPGTDSLSITSYTGGGPRLPVEPLRNPGYLICQHAEEDGVQYMRCIDYGTSGRTRSWAQVESDEE